MSTYTPADPSHREPVEGCPCALCVAHRTILLQNDALDRAMHERMALRSGLEEIILNASLALDVGR